MRALLHADFVEIGRSGRRWSREQIVAALADEADTEALVAVADEADAELPATDEWTFTEVSADLTLVTYLLRGPGGVSRHSSLWDTSSGSPVMRFHQGTVVPA
ncbi:hypothetical protein GCM10011313_14380 [Mycetocola zhadangensis]|nr:hypothetical protein GCM10011313_14380 [Mycetocola zhadangensis]